jgi:hypothetical protein
VLAQIKLVVIFLDLCFAGIVLGDEVFADKIVGSFDLDFVLCLVVFLFFVVKNACE